MKKHASKFKPLLFTTTVRNPSRLKGLLNVLAGFNEQILTNDLAQKICGEIIRYGLYRPTKGITHEIEKKWGGKKITETSPIGNVLLTDEETVSLLHKNPQNHKEAGFEKGWPSRFATIFDFGKELGFVYYWPGEKIKFSEIGLRLANSIELASENGDILLSDSHPEFEQQAFLNALAKSQRNNPFVKVLNENVPLLLLLEVIKKLNDDSDFNGAGISKFELPLVIFWKDSDAEKLYQRIKRLRKEHGYTPSGEIVADICRTEIMEGKDKKRKDKSIISEYPDDFIRKMRLTGLISLRGAGRFIDINKNEQSKVDYILSKYSTYNKYSSEKEYFEYVSKIDENLILAPSVIVSITEQNKYLKRWLEVYSWDVIRTEMLVLSSRSFTKDATLKYLPNPIRLEFLTALAVKSKFPNANIIPNYPVDDEGLPTSTAPGVGNTGDIECFENTNGILIEVTMSGGRTQTMMEVWPIARHLETFSKKTSKAMCYFVAPSIFSDSVKQIEYVKQTEKLSIYPKTIEQFLEHLDKSKELYCSI